MKTCAPQEEAAGLSMLTGPSAALQTRPSPWLTAAALHLSMLFRSLSFPNAPSSSGPRHVLFLPLGKLLLAFFTH